jgi:Concanavalin A-like lectin/glucanases superfamily
MQAPANNIQNSISNIGKQLPEVPTTAQVSQTATEGIKSINNTVAAAQTTISNSLGEFSSQNAVNGSSDFLNSNSIIAKFVFLILVLIVFSVLVNLGIYLIMYFSQQSRSPYVIYGMVSGNAQINVKQDPRDSNAVTIFRSNNQANGLEMTWSVWLLINDLNANTNQAKAEYSHIFNKGDAKFNPDVGTALVNNSPGVYVGKSNPGNVLHILMDTVDSPDATGLDVTGVPLKKWFHVAIRMQNNIMDVYLNGVISGRRTFKTVPKQNYDDVHVGYNGGFNGNLSNLVYYDRALSVFDINNIILKGPNLTQSAAVTSNLGYYGYLSTSWYSQKLGGM